ncbi:hypothetical protein ABEB36_002167 [Hypothenemus hampei]|uniref:Glutathione peroxidase n=1 Tax=Hypothenemus hampei TaxID=57062 RepID=A0ABD1F4T3_HYPHA
MFRPRVYAVAALCIQAVLAQNSAKTIYDFTAKDIHGNDVSLEKYRGHVCIIVNVASECGLTNNNYDQLNYLYQRYGKNQGLKILAFPSNEFGGQEPGSNDDILRFAKSKGVNFDLFSKIEVNGDNAHPLWKFLKAQQGGFLVDSIKWNFTKFLVDKNGRVVERYSPTTTPNEMVEDIEKLLDYNIKGDL